MTKIQDDEVFSILTGKVSNAINRAFLRAFAQENINVTTEQWSVLVCLWKKDMVTQQTLCVLTLKDKPSMTRLIDSLEKRNLAIRMPDKLDRRINLICLTKEGKELETKATEVVNSIALRTLNGVTDDEMNVARAVLKKVMANLE